MSKYCPSCHAEVNEQDAFCQNCSAKLESTNQSQVQGDFYQNNSGGYGGPQSGVTSTQARPKRNNHILFLFVTSLIFMVFFAIRCITTLASFDTWIKTSNMLALSNATMEQKAVVSSFLGTIGFSLFAAFLSFALVLTFFIMTSKLRKYHFGTDRAKLATVAPVISILVLVAGLAYAASEIMILLGTTDVMKLFPDAFTEAEIFTNQAQMFGALIFDLVFAVFSIINIIKAFLFKKEINKISEENI